MHLLSVHASPAAAGVLLDVLREQEPSRGVRWAASLGWECWRGTRNTSAARKSVTHLFGNQ